MNSSFLRRAALSHEWRRFAVAAALALVASVLFLIWTAFRLGGDKTTIAIDDIGAGVASGIAAVSLAVAAGTVAGAAPAPVGAVAAECSATDIGRARQAWGPPLPGAARPLSLPD